MKKLLCMLLIAGLIACQAPVQPSQNITQPKNEEKVIILEEFAKLDLELNTSWHEEQIPKNIIKLEAIEPWTAQMLFIRNRTNDTTLLNLIDARIDMLKSQLSFILMAKLGEKADINMTKNNQTFVPTEKINCEDSKTIIKGLGLYNTAFTSWKNFTLHMDKALQDQELRTQIGTDENKPKFYVSAFADAEARISAIKKAVYDECRIEVVIQ